LDLPRARDVREDANRGGEYFAVWRPDGSLLKARGLPGGTGAPDMPLSPRPRLIEREEFREAVMGGPAGTRVLVGRSVRRESEELRAFAWQLAGAGAVVLAVGLAGGWLASSRILRPVAAISATASAISATNLSRRIDPEGVDRELAGLARVLNATFDRLQAAFERQARFTADASHELRTPLAILRSHAELALSRPRTEAEYREALGACLRAAGRMTGLVEGLLTLARADAGKLDLRRGPVDLRALVEESVSLFGPLARDKDVTLSTRLCPAEVSGDSLRLGQVVTNLLSNAVAYNRPGGQVVVRLEGSAGDIALAVSDTGCGIPAQDRPHIFERFYRVDKARSRASGGNGLGLAICKSIVEAHGGTIGFESEPGRGSTFWVRLPRG
jgi:heavy metal sensor kinase